jgi:hypothetical protein
MSTFIVDNLKGKTTANTMTVLAGHATDSTTTTNLEQGLAKAWINFNGTGTIAERDSFNTTSLTDGGTGTYSFDFTNDMNNNDYAISGGARSPGVLSGMLQAPSASETSAATDSLEIYSTNVSGSLADINHVYVIIHGDLA